MDFKTLLMNRRAIREFQDKAVSLAIIEAIIRDTCLAPTACNLQPCGFIVVQDRDFMKMLSDDSKKNLVAAIEKDPDSPMKPYEDALRDEQYNVFYNAPCLVYIAGPKAAPLLDIDCALAAAYFMFSAASRGLGTCWVELGIGIHDPGILQKMEMPANHRIVAPIILGYPTAIPAAPERHEPIIIKIV